MFQIKNDESKLCLIRVTIRAIFTGRALARISILPKISRFWLFALCRSIVVWHYFTRARESRADGSLCFRIALAVLWCHTMIGAQLHVERTNKHVCIFALLWSFSPSHAPRLVNYIHYLHVIGQTTLDVLGNIKILARTCPVWMALMATLRLMYIYIYTNIPPRKICKYSFKCSNFIGCCTYC